MQVGMNIPLDPYQRFIYPRSIPTMSHEQIEVFKDGRTQWLLYVIVNGKANDPHILGNFQVITQKNPKIRLLDLSG